jgi:hypothetical protein
MGTGGGSVNSPAALLRGVAFEPSPLDGGGLGGVIVPGAASSARGAARYPCALLLTY